jgi:hypothetical protein
MKGERMKTGFRPLIIALLSIPMAGLAAGDPGGSSVPGTPADAAT